MDSKVSGTSEVTSGVPQGTVMGPLPLLLYINDISMTCRNRIHLMSGGFADDYLLYRTIRKREDCHVLQHDLDNFQKWEDTWIMNFDPDKCEVFSSHKQKEPDPYLIHDPWNALAFVKLAKYLGLNISANLSLNGFIDKITKKANSVTVFLNRNIKICPMNIKAKC